MPSKELPCCIRTVLFLLLLRFRIGQELLRFLIEKEYKYPTPIDKSFAIGIYEEVVSGKGRRQIRKLDVPVFKLTHEVDIDWIETWGLQLALPDEGKPFKAVYGPS